MCVDAWCFHHKLDSVYLNLFGVCSSWIHLFKSGSASLSLLLSCKAALIEPGALARNNEAVHPGRFSLLLLRTLLIAMSLFVLVNLQILLDTTLLIVSALMDRRYEFTNFTNITVSRVAPAILSEREAWVSYPVPTCPVDI